jgi:hypothetical protein
MLISDRSSQRPRGRPAIGRLHPDMSPAATDYPAANDQPRIRIDLVSARSAQIRRTGGRLASVGVRLPRSIVQFRNVAREPMERITRDIRRHYRALEASLTSG